MKCIDCTLFPYCINTVSEKCLIEGNNPNDSNTNSLLVEDKFYNVTSIIDKLNDSLLGVNWYDFNVIAYFVSSFHFLINNKKNLSYQEFFNLIKELSKSTEVDSCKLEYFNDLIIKYSL